MPRYKLIAAFDGTDFFGWQAQPGVRTVEEEIEQKASMIARETIDLVGQGRTDSGVHASGQAAHFDTVHSLDTEQFVCRLNKVLTGEIYIRSVEEVAETFHARFDAVSRVYEYRLLETPDPMLRKYAFHLHSAFEIEAVQSALELLKGEHDFLAFSKINPELLHYRCHIIEAECLPKSNGWVIRLEGNRFLRNMVRRLVGSLLLIADGTLPADSIDLALKGEKELAPKRAPAHGLTLVEVRYPFPAFD